MATSIADQTELNTTTFKLNQLVFVESRTGPNENKQGGVGRISAISDDLSTYSIKYILGGKENGVHVRYISLHSFEESRARVPIIKPSEEFEKPVKNERKCETKTSHVPNQVSKNKKSKPTADEKQESIHKENIHIQSALRPLGHENVDVQIKKPATIDLVAEETVQPQKEAQEAVDTFPEEELMTFNQALRLMFQSRDSISFGEALAILPDETKSRRAIQILQDQNRIFVPESGEEIWTI